MNLNPIKEKQEDQFSDAENFSEINGEDVKAERKEISFLTQLPQLSAFDPHIRLFDYIGKSSVGTVNSDQPAKKYPCKYCGEKFSNGCALGGHISKMHKGLSYLNKRHRKNLTTKFTEKDRARYFRKHIKKKFQ